MAKKKKAATNTITAPVLLGGTTVTPANAIGGTQNTAFQTFQPTMTAAVTSPESFGLPQAPQAPAAVTGGGTPPVSTGGAATGDVVVGGTNVGGGQNPPAAPLFATNAMDAFKKTLALIMGEKEANKAYTSSVFNRFFAYQKQGVPDDTALNLVLRDARTDESLAPFRTRFRAILALEDMRSAGKIVSVPTIQEYIKSEQALGDLLNKAELGDLATEDNIAEIFSRGKSVKEAGDIIATVSSRVKNAPLEVRKQWQALYPTMTDVQLTKALLLGPKGAAEIERQAKGLDIRGAAAEAKSLMPTQTEAEELAAKGYTYGTTLKGFQNIAGFFPQAQLITERFKRAPLTAQEAMAYEFGGDAAAKKTIEQISALESAGFQKRSGTTSVSLGTGTKGLI